MAIVPDPIPMNSLAVSHLCRALTGNGQLQVSFPAFVTKIEIRRHAGPVPVHNTVAQTAIVSTNSVHMEPDAFIPDSVLSFFSRDVYHPNNAEICLPEGERLYVQRHCGKATTWLHLPKALSRHSQLAYRTKLEFFEITAAVS